MVAAAVKKEIPMSNSQDQRQTGDVRQIAVGHRHFVTRYDLESTGDTRRTSTSRSARFTMKLRLLFLMGSLAWIDQSVWAQQKTATLTANSRSLSLSPASFYNPFYGTLTDFFTTFDGRTDTFPLVQRVGLGTILFSGELRPRSAQAGVYEMDYAIYSGTFGWVEYGSITANLPTTDSDNNGLPDVAQRDKAVNISFNGTIKSDAPSVQTTSYTGSMTRAAGQISGSYSTTSANGITLSGNVQVQNVSGTVTYSRGPQNLMTLNLSLSDPVGTTRTANGSTTFTVNSVNQITFPQFLLTSSDNKTYTVLTNSVLNRSGKRYAGNAALADGIVETSWADAVNWVVEITDNNDSDGNGIPDLSDTVTVPKPVMSYSRSGTNLVLAWTGQFILQSSTNVSGPYSDLSGITSPYATKIASEARRFFRLRN